MIIDLTSNRLFVIKKIHQNQLKFGT